MIHQPFLIYSHRCCGGSTYTIGYRVWSTVPAFNAENAVPDSCCHRPTPGCGLGVMALPSAAVHEHIYVSGCLQVVYKADGQ